jgi:purine-binding chemotaxis protein CheW
LKLHIVFSVNGVEYALPVDWVLQMETFTGVTSVPGTPDYVVGVVTVRGRVVPVVDLRLRFGLPAVPMTHDSRIIVTQVATRVVALRVDSAREVIVLDPEQHQPAPELVNERSAGLVRGMHALGARLLLLIDLPKVLGEHAHDHEHRALLDDSERDRPALPG